MGEVGGGDAPLPAWGLSVQLAASGSYGEAAALPGASRQSEGPTLTRRGFVRFWSSAGELPMAAVMVTVTLQLCSGSPQSHRRGAWWGAQRICLTLPGRWLGPLLPNAFPWLRRAPGLENGTRGHREEAAGSLCAPQLFWTQLIFHCFSWGGKKRMVTCRW